MPALREHFAETGAADACIFRKTPTAESIGDRIGWVETRSAGALSDDGDLRGKLQYRAGDLGRTSESRTAAGEDRSRRQELRALNRFQMGIDLCEHGLELALHDGLRFLGGDVASSNRAALHLLGLGEGYLERECECVRDLSRAERKHFERDRRIFLEHDERERLRADVGEEDPCSLLASRERAKACGELACHDSFYLDARRLDHVHHLVLMLCERCDEERVDREFGALQAVRLAEHFDAVDTVFERNGMEDRPVGESALRSLLALSERFFDVTFLYYTSRDRD